MKRADGSGTVEKTRSGRHIARVPRTVDPSRKSLGTFATSAEAHAMLDAAMAEIADGKASIASGAPTLATYCKALLARRKRDGAGGAAADKSRFVQHIAAEPFASWPIGNVTARDVRTWRDALQVKIVTRKRRGVTTSAPLSRQSIKNAMNLVRAAFAAAVEDGAIPSNPAADVSITRKDRHVTEEPWTFLTIDEQRAIAGATLDGAELAAVRLMALFCIGTGLRRGEQWNMELRDLVVDGDDPHVTVRFGSPGKLPKNGKARRVPLFGVALDAARRWLRVLPRYATRRVPGTDQREPFNPLGLVFPTARGARREKAPKAWPEVLAAAGVTRPVRWHDLRHTCASSCVAGWWGRRWSLEEVCALLGHSSIKVTERYAHLAENALTAAAKSTPGGGGAGQRVASGDPKNTARPGRFERPTLGSVDLGTSRETPANLDADGHTLATLAADVLRAVALGSDDRDARAVRLAGAVLDAVPGIVAALRAGGAA